MPIPFSKYVEITSGVVAAGAVSARDLILRLYSNNAKLSLQSVYEFDTTDSGLSAIATFFGSTSEEYKRAASYAAWVSPIITRPKKISFARFSRTAVASALYGDTSTKTLSAITAITSGNMAISLDGTTYNLTALNFSSAASLTAVATILQTAINALSPATLAGATVVYDATSKRFVITLATTGSSYPDFYVTASNVNDVGAALGMLLSSTSAYSSPDNAMKVIGGAAELPIDAFNRAVGISTNFGSFLFMDTAVTPAEAASVATANKARNNDFMYLVRVTKTDAASFRTALQNIGGCAINLVNSPGVDFTDQYPGTIQAAIDYTRRNGVIGFDFRQFSDGVVTVSGSEYSTYDTMRVNYYGRTERNGQLLDFFQDGVLQGLSTDPSDMNVYSNEQWFKDQCAVAFINAQLSLPQIPADDTGIAIGTGLVTTVISDALYNGVINVGKPLTNLQKTYIAEQTGDARAWYQVQSVGWYLTVSIESYVDSSGATKWKLVYTVIYSKNDTIRKFEGTHQLV
jgi:Protein of unknown function (DUF3383)